MNEQTLCPGCNLLSQQSLTLFESNFWKVDLARNQAYLGRAFVTLKRHAGNLSALTPAEWQDLGELVRHFEEAASKAFGATCFNWTALMNDTYKQESPNPHVHLHVWPRYQTAPIVNEIVFEDPNFAHHYDKKANRNIEPIVLATIRTKFIDQYKQ